MKPKFEVRAALNPPTFPLEEHTGCDWQVWRMAGLFRKEKLIQTFISANDAQILCNTLNGDFSMPPMDNF